MAEYKGGEYLYRDDDDDACPASGRKGTGLFCDACYARLSDDLKDELIRAKEALWKIEARCLIALEGPPKRRRRPAGGEGATDG